MPNHPNRGPRSRPQGPTAEQVIAARDAAGHTQTQAARVLDATLSGWQRWEQGERQMTQVLFDTYRLRTGQHPEYVLLPRDHIDWMFSGAEWNALRDMLNGSLPNEPVCALAGSLAHGWADSLAHGIDQKWGVDGAALLNRLQALTLPEEAAVIAAVRAWWDAQRG